MMLRMNGEGSDYGSWEAGSYVFDGTDPDDFDDPNGDYDGTDADDDGEYEDEDAFDVHAHAEDLELEDNNPSDELDPASFPSDEAYARALQDAEEREMALRLMALAGLNDGVCLVGCSYLIVFVLLLLVLINDSNVAYLFSL